MTLTDYLIAVEDQDWGELLSEWAWLLPPSFTVWLVNRYGDVMFRPADDSVQMLDVGSGEVTRLADNREHFQEIVDFDRNADNWFMIPLVDQCVNAGLLLEAGQCYTYAKPPVLGGEYTTENTRVIAIGEHYGFYGSLHRQLRDLPDGAQVELKWKR